jgi:hypothetical protein
MLAQEAFQVGGEQGEEPTIPQTSNRLHRPESTVSSQSGTQKESAMATSYWARWACNGQVCDLAELMLPHVLAEGYDLLTCNEDRQSFDRGGTMKRISWSLNGGRWETAPIDLTITYSCLPTRTVVNFYWRLAIRPLPTTPMEQASFETHLQRQMDRIIASLSQQVASIPAEEDQEAADEGAALQTFWESGQEDAWDMLFPSRPARTDAAGQQDVSTMDLVAQRARTHHNRMQVDAGAHCDVCGSPAARVPGTSDRYFCLICQHHLPHQIVAG